jgi:predicted ATP-grasp superfamily ATP-dependent carboligase
MSNFIVNLIKRKTKMNILITSAIWKATLTCMKSFAKKGHSVSLLSDNEYSPGLFSKFCSEKIISPKERDREAYMEFLLSLVKTRKYDLLIPISDLCMEYFIESQQELSKYVKILLPPKEAVYIALNKDKTYRFANENGIPIPETHFPQTLSEVEQIANYIAYPCMVKNPKGWGGRGHAYINSKETLVSFFNKFSENGAVWPIVQKFIKSPSNSFLAFCKAGEVLDFFMYQRIRQYPETTGSTVLAKSIFDERVLEISKSLIRKLSWDGPLSLDFFITEDKRFLLSEINPRFSGLIEFAYACGIDFPSEYLELISGNDFKPFPKRYKTGRYYRSIFPEEIKLCLEKRKYIPHFLINFLRPNVYYNFSFSDKRLLLWQIKDALWSIKNHAVRKWR